MITVEKPPLDDDLLVHFGVPGMKWGRRKAVEYTPTGRPAGSAQPVSQRPRLSAGQKKAIRSAVAVGAVAGLFVLAQRGQGPRALALQSKMLPIGVKANQKVLSGIGKTTVRSVPKVITTAKVTGKVGYKTAKGTGKVSVWAGKKIAKGSYNGAVNRGQTIAASYGEYQAKRALRNTPRVSRGARISQALMRRFGSARTP